MLIAYDGGPSATRAVEHVAGSPLHAGLAVTVVTVGTPSDRVKKALSDAESTLAAAGIDAETRVLPGEPEAALGAFVEAEKFDMLVMGAYGHSRIRSLIIGSTTTEMIRSCRVPIVLVR